MSEDGGLVGWTPVRQCTCIEEGGHVVHVNLIIIVTSDSDTEDRVIPRSATVKYMVAADGSPGVHISSNY